MTSTAKQLSFEELLQRDGYLVYTNIGNSMRPLLRPRQDIIEVRKKDSKERCERYDVVLYKSHGKYILHRVCKVRPNDYIICGDHNVWREYGITDEQILGVMTRVIRDGESIYPTDWKYKVYVHLWCDFYHIRAAILYANILFRAAGRRLKKLVKREM